jgi:hypothetical protein
MWLHHDLAWWGVFLGGLALVLMFPANIVANLVPPKLKNWWAERSVASTRERIEKLKKQLADYEQHRESYGLVTFRTILSIARPPV